MHPRTRILVYRVWPPPANQGAWIAAAAVRAVTSLPLISKVECTSMQTQGHWQAILARSSHSSPCPLLILHLANLIYCQLVPHFIAQTCQPSGLGSKMSFQHRVKYLPGAIKAPDVCSWVADICVTASFHRMIREVNPSSCLAASAIPGPGRGSKGCMSGGQ